MNTRPLRWLSAICWTVLALLLCACSDDDAPSADGGTTASAVGDVDGVVQVSGLAAVVAGAHVSAAGVAADSGADGRFTLHAVPAGDRVVLKVQAEGYADAVAVTPVTAQASTSLVLHLTPTRFTSAPLDPAQANTVTVPGSAARVVLPANGLQGPGGTAVSGPVIAQLTPIDPSADARSMPGDYSSSTGARLESFGALHVALSDGRGTRLNLRPGSSAVIRIPVPPASTAAPATVPLYALDEASGRWVQEGSATLAGSGMGRYYEGSVSHFSDWNADAVADSVHVRGCVADAAGQPVAAPDRVTAEAAGLDYQGLDSDALVALHQGRFDLVVKKFAAAKLDAQAAGGRASNAVVVHTQDQDIDLAPCLRLADATAAVPAIVQQPVDATVVAVGDLVVFQVVAAGGEPLFYQWRRNGVDIPGAVQREYVLEATVDELSQQGGSFDVVVSNAKGKATSVAARLVVKPAGGLSFSKQPQGQTVQAGDVASFSVVVVGSASTVSYQWRRDGIAIPGATAASYTTPPLGESDSGAVFSVVATNASNAVISDGAAVSVLAPPPPPVSPAAPAITAQPASRSLAPGGQALFQVTASGNPAPAFQWLRNGQPIAGATLSAYLTPAITAADNGARFAVVVSNTQGSVTSSEAVLTVAGGLAHDIVQLAFDAARLGVAGASPMALLVDATLTVQDTSALFVAGSFSAGFNGGALPAAGSALPAKGSLTASFTNARTDAGKIFDAYDGSATIDYQLAAPVNAAAPDDVPINGSITTTARRMHVQGSSNGVAMNIDYVADGQADTSYAGASSAAGELRQTSTLVPAAGATLLESASGLKASFVSGQVQVETVRSPLQAKTSPLPILVLTQLKTTYAALTFTIDGVTCVANGTYQFQPGSGSAASGSGEVVVTQGGTQVGRIFADSRGVHFDIAGQVFDTN